MSSLDVDDPVSNPVNSGPMMGMSFKNNDDRSEDVLDFKFIVAAKVLISGFVVIAD